MKSIFKFLALPLVLLVVGCGGSQMGKTIQVGVVLPTASEERWANQDGRYFTEMLADYEHEVLFSDGDEARERQNVEALISRGAQVIILTTQGSGAGAIQVAEDAGVPIIAHDRMAKSSQKAADFYTSFNSWEVGKAMGQHLVDKARELGYSASNKADLALFAGRVADYPNATYFFGGAMEALQPNLMMFNIINVGATSEKVQALDLYKEEDFGDMAMRDLQDVMAEIDTDWNVEVATTKAAAVVNALGTSDMSGKDVFVLAPNDDTSSAIRLEFAKMGDNSYGGYYTTGQDASDVAIASLLGDPVKGNGVQSMTVFKDTSKLAADSVAVAKNILKGASPLEGLAEGRPIDGVPTVYSPIDVLTIDNPQQTYDLILASKYKDENSPAFSGVDFSQWK